MTVEPIESEIDWSKANLARQHPEPLHRSDSGSSLYDIHMVEVVRSCPLCRFAWPVPHLPFRTPSLDDGLIPAVERAFRQPNVWAPRSIGHPTTVR